MTDNLRARIAVVQLAHMPDDYERDMGECPCGFKFQKWSELASHVADAVIAELGRYEYAIATDDLQFFCMYADERSELMQSAIDAGWMSVDGVNLHPDEQIVRRYVTNWEPSD